MGGEWSGCGRGGGEREARSGGRGDAGARSFRTVEGLGGGVNLCFGPCVPTVQCEIRKGTCSSSLSFIAALA